MKTFLFRSMIGLFFGAFLGVMFTFALIYFGEKPVLDSGLFVKNILGFIFCGWFFTVSPLYFEIKSLRLSQQTALHFATIAILYFVLALGIGWVPINTGAILITAGSFLLVYLIMWTCFYLYFKNEARKLTEGLKDI